MLALRYLAKVVVIQVVENGNTNIVLRKSSHSVIEWDWRLRRL